MALLLLGSNKISGQHQQVDSGGRHDARIQHALRHSQNGVDFAVF